jgi:chromosome segregation ATPase
MRSLAAALCALAVASAAPLADAGDSGRDGYCFSFGGSLHASNIDLDQMLRVRKARTGDFLWFRRGGRQYLVTDAATLAEGGEILRPLRELAREQERVSERLRPFESEERELDDDEEELEEQAERLEDRNDHAAAEQRRRLESLQRELETKLRALEARMREIEDEERVLEDRERELERVADAKVERLIADALRRGLARPLR